MCVLYVGHSSNLIPAQLNRPAGFSPGLSVWGFKALALAVTASYTVSLKRKLSLSKRRQTEAKRVRARVELWEEKPDRER